jgi:hypothetical protein
MCIGLDDQNLIPTKGQHWIWSHSTHEIFLEEEWVELEADYYFLLVLGLKMQRALSPYCISLEYWYIA